MPAALQLHLTAAAYTAVEHAFETTCAAETRLRYQMVLLAADGHTAPQIAPLVRRSVDTVPRVLRRYQTGGLAEVPRHAPPGRAVSRPGAWEAELRRVIELDPQTVGIDSANWTTELLAAYLAAQTGCRMGIETVRQALHRAGYVCKRPTWTLQRRAEQEPEWATNA
jgi:transposase